MASDMRVSMAALSVAMRARTGALEAGEVKALFDMVREDLAGRDHLRQAIARFAAQYVGVRRDPEALAEAGAALQHAVSIAMMPAAAGLDRSDIHG